jgi:transcription-repair coupling factor (superfamily II helicase)
MVFQSLIRSLTKSTLTQELVSKLESKLSLHLKGAARLPKGLITSALCQAQQRNLLVICATIEESARWAAQLELMGWKQVFFYPTSEASLYEPLDPESEMIWGQLQTLSVISNLASGNTEQIAIVATEKALQPHLPPLEVFEKYCLSITQGMTENVKTLEKKLTRMGYERVNLVEMEGQWSRRGDILDLFPVSAELPVRLEWFGDELERIREFDPTTQSSLEPLESLILTPTNWSNIIGDHLTDLSLLKPYLSSQEYEGLENGIYPEGMTRFLGFAFPNNSNKQNNQIASILDYLPTNTILAVDELEQCKSHGRIWFEETEEKWQLVSLPTPQFWGELSPAPLPPKLGGNSQPPYPPNLGETLSSPTPQTWGKLPAPLPPKLGGNSQPPYPPNLGDQGGKNLPKFHRKFTESLILNQLPTIYLSELAEENTNVNDVIYGDLGLNSNLSNREKVPELNLSSRPVPVTPHQIAKIAEILRGKKEIYGAINLSKYATWLISAQPLRSVSLLQEHDCNTEFISNPIDYPSIEKYQRQNIPVALKYSGQAEVEGFILPTFRIAVITDREFFGQHSLATPSYIRKRRQAVSKQVDLNKLKPGDYVVHKNYGIGRFLNLETLINREYLSIEYADGLLKLPADSLELISRYNYHGKTAPKLHRMSGKEWEKTKNQVRKSIKKLAVDLLNLYAQRSKLTGFAYPKDTPWQEEFEDSFPYQPTPDQLKAVQDIKIDLESDRPMDRLLCGDVGFGKTEVAIRAIFKAITTGNKQVALLAPTTILTQQHYHTLKERFAPYPINVGLLNRFRTASERKEILQKLATGELDVVVGTHQLLSSSIKFKDLGLLVIDEEQRFGVNHKEKIKAMKTALDVLTLSATPIPRTLYMSLSGIREMSLITTPPPNRRAIKTHLSPYNPEVVRNAIRNELDRGGQIFYVTSSIEYIETIATQLQLMIPSLRVAIAHGQMLEGELETTMLTFNNGEADLLVCTTIIESGLDIPRVNTIIIEDSHRFGLAQLYQLRGRVGRAGIQAHAWLLYPHQEKLTDTAKKRLRALQEFSQLGSGYHLAMRDLEIRGVGTLLGAEQSGKMEAVGFELYMSMLQDAFNEIQGQEIPQVEDTQIDLALTAFIPNSYISDFEQKMDAYRAVATANSERGLKQIEEKWLSIYGIVPDPAQQLIKVALLKQIAKSLGFSRIKKEGQQNIILETPMQEPAWKRLAEKLPSHLQNRFMYAPKKVIVRGLATLKPSQQLDNLLQWLSLMSVV